MDNKNVVIKHKGYCPICELNVTFFATNYWFRDSLICPECRSIPRERVFMRVISEIFPDYKRLLIHESSPINRGVSDKLEKECDGYSVSQFYNGLNSGDINQESGIQCENIEAMSFKDSAFVLFITQDVMEYIFHPERAFKEIARVLKPNGDHIFTVPIANKEIAIEMIAFKQSDGGVIYLKKKEFHSKPISDKGSLVAMNWGWDIACFLIES